MGNYLCGEFAEAVSCLALACELMTQQYGETADECADSYFHYGKALLELAKMKPIFGNQLVRTFGMNKYLKGHLGDKERSAVTGKAKGLVLKNRVSVGHEGTVSDYEKMRLANIKERKEQYA